MKNKIIIMIFFSMTFGMIYQTAQAQGNCPGNKVRMSTGLRGCGCNTCQKKCVDPADVQTYLNNGWYYGDCSRLCCMGSGWRAMENEDMTFETSITDVYPNPASGLITIAFTLSDQADVTLQLFDMMGRHSATIAHEFFENKINELTWDAGGLPPGIYFLKMQAGDESITKRITVIR